MLTSGHSRRRASMMSSIPWEYCAHPGSVPYAIAPADRIPNPISTSGKITSKKITGHGDGCETGGW